MPPSVNLGQRFRQVLPSPVHVRDVEDFTYPIHDVLRLASIYDYVISLQYIVTIVCRTRSLYSSLLLYEAFFTCRIHIPTVSPILGSIFLFLSLTLKA